eukprot:m.368139 g.368139  ORF g.368139 m.368139 type:complete len:51 (+) comp44009_c0_seq1:213-365(+)
MLYRFLVNSKQWLSVTIVTVSTTQKHCSTFMCISNVYYIFTHGGSLCVDV